MRKHISTTVRVTETQDQRVKRLSKLIRIPQAEIIRMGIDIALMKYGAQNFMTGEINKGEENDKRNI